MSKLINALLVLAINGALAQQVYAAQNEEWLCQAYCYKKGSSAWDTKQVPGRPLEAKGHDKDETLDRIIRQCAGDNSGYYRLAASFGMPNGSTILPIYDNDGNNISNFDFSSYQSAAFCRQTK